VIAAQQHSASSSHDPSKSDPGPKNVALDTQNPDSNDSPSTDAGGLPPFKYPFSFGHKRLHE
jgi:oxalate decarboxylase